jgi:hypothetical protein
VDELPGEVRLQPARTTAATTHVTAAGARSLHRTVLLLAPTRRRQTVEYVLRMLDYIVASNQRQIRVGCPSSG